MAARPEIETDVAPVARTDSPEWRYALTWGVITYLASRVMVIAGAAAVSAAKVSAVVECESRGVEICGQRPQSAAAGIIEALTSWDGQWYFSLIRRGYPTSVPAHITYAQPEARAAFFPLYPWLVRAVDAVLPGSDVTAALVLNFLLGLAFVIAMGVLAALGPVWKRRSEP